MFRIAHWMAVIFVLILAVTASGQSVPSSPADSIDPRARTAMDRGDYLAAIPILSDALAQRPNAEAYLNLGVAFRHMRDWQKAEDTLTEGSERYPEDPRLSTELANAYLGAGDVDGARNALHRALRIDPTNLAAADLISAIELSEGEVQTALRIWNRSGNPIVERVLHNSNLEFGHWTVRQANAFRPGKMMTYRQWRTTQLRLLETGIFSNVGVDVEPAPASNRYNPIILTSAKSNDLGNLVFGIAKGAFIETTYLDYWDIAHSGVTLNSSYRWDYNRKRGEVQLHAPVPFPGILFLNATGLWRSERWDLTRVLQTDAGTADRFDFKSTGARLEFKYIPHYRFDFGGGFEYTNRAANGGLTRLLMDGSNSGKILFQGSIRLADGRYRNRLHVEGFVARRNIMGDLNYSAATAEMNHQLLIQKDSNTVFVWKLKGGTSRGQLPVEEYFVLGLDSHSGNLLRAHPVAEHGHYGNAPMGTSFALSNMSVERRVAILPLFNTLNLPFLDVKGQFFLDTGKTFDREHLFKEGKLHVDTGAGLKFETPTHSLNLIYGRALREGRNVLFAYIEKRW